MKKLDKEALEYHASGRPGKIEVIATKPANTEKFLSLAYSPGVAAPCKEIHRSPESVYDYTAKGNLVAVISDGTAVLGLGNIGPLAAKPVMEGKGVLFKQFADIDVFDIELKTSSVEEFISAVQTMEPTFGGINLEDIKAPECFEIEQRLQKLMNIPVFHDDQHGTAIISGAALINACYLQGKDLKNIRLVVNGAGASAISCTRMFVSLGVQLQNILMCDTKGVIRHGRTDEINKYKAEFMRETDRISLADAVKDADVFVGLSVGGALTTEMLMTMAPKAIVFAMANPDPEIDPKLAKKTRPDIIMATGRTDFPNQVNNVLGFPFIFRGALDVRATTINEAMKLAAVKAIAQLAREGVTENVSEAYQGSTFRFGPEYIIPKPFDTRVLLWVAPAVAKAAMESGVARKPIEDFQAYHNRLESILGPSKVFVRNLITKVQSSVRDDKQRLPRLVFPEGLSKKILKALQGVIEEGICQPVLLGYEDRIRPFLKELEIANLSDIEIIQPSLAPQYKAYCERLYQKRSRKGVSLTEAARLMVDPQYFAAMMVECGDADGLVTGATLNYADAIKPLLHSVTKKQNEVVAGFNIVIAENRILFFADTTVHINPSAEDLASIASQVADFAQSMGIDPRIALLSYSNFSGRDGSPAKMVKACQILKQRRPDLAADGEMQADTAANSEILAHLFPFSELVGKGPANVFVFPNLESSNIAYKLLQQLSKAEVLGPFLVGMNSSINVVQRTTTVSQIMNSIAMTAMQAASVLKV